MLKEKIIERQALREKVLSSLYDQHYMNNGAPYRTTRNELSDIPEERMAYDYLAGKGFIQVERQGNQNINIQITTLGIDVFEKNFLSQ